MGVGEAPLRSSVRMARLGTHLVPSQDSFAPVQAEPTANVFKKWLFDVWWFNDWNGNPDEQDTSSPAPPSPPAPPTSAPAPPPPKPPEGVDFSTDAAAWRQFCADAREAGVKVPMIYPHSVEKEAGLLEKLRELSGDAPAPAAAPAAAPPPAAAPVPPPPSPPPAPSPPPVADVPDVDFSGVDFATDTAAWRQFCDMARANGLKVPTIYPHSPAREASLKEELGILAGDAPAEATAGPEEPEEPEQPAVAEAVDQQEELPEEPAATGAVYTMEDVAEHSSRDDAWLVINDRVYDITDFVSQHPGGAIILSVAGQDATDFFMELHKEEILTEVAEDYFIGTIG